MNGGSVIATNSYTNLIQVEEVPHLHISLVNIEVSVEVTGRGPSIEYIATLKKTYNHHKVNANSKQKLLTLKKSKFSGEYFFTGKIRIDKVKRKHLKNSDWCYFCNFTNPCELIRLVKLKAKDWKTMDEKLVRVLNAAKCRNPALTIYWADWNLWS